MKKVCSENSNDPSDPGTGATLTSKAHSVPGLPGGSRATDSGRAIRREESRR
jgi:hypothetical protein